MGCVIIIIGIGQRKGVPGGTHCVISSEERMLCKESYLYPKLILRPFLAAWAERGSGLRGMTLKS